MSLHSASGSPVCISASCNQAGRIDKHARGLVSRQAHVRLSRQAGSSTVQQASMLMGRQAMVGSADRQAHGMA